jgi:hypothetical protein
LLRVMKADPSTSTLSHFEDDESNLYKATCDESSTISNTFELILFKTFKFRSLFDVKSKSRDIVQHLFPEKLFLSC